MKKFLVGSLVGLGLLSGLFLFNAPGIAGISITPGGGVIKSLEAKDEGSSVDGAVFEMDFTGAGVTATQTAAGIIEVAVPGGGGIQVLQSAPGSPADEEQWFLEVAAVAPTTISVSIPTQSPLIDMSVPTPTAQDLLDLGGGVDWATISWDDQSQSGISVSNDSQGVVTVSYEGAVSTNQNIVDAINVYSQAEITKDIAVLAQGAQGGNSFQSDAGQDSSGSNQVFNDGSAASVVLEIFLTPTTFTFSPN